MKKVIVVGAGLGGLIAAGLLASRGNQVKLLERSPILGGRSHVLQKDGFTMSYGAHALLAPKAEPMKTILKELGIRLKSANPSLTKFKLYSGGRVISSPLGAGAFTSPSIDGFKNRLMFFKQFFQMMKAKKQPANVTVQQWMDQNIKEPSIAKVIRAYSGLTVYDQALDRYSMNAFTEHAGILYASLQSLVYVGYDELLEQLKQAIFRNGGEIHCSHEVTGVVVEDGKVTGVTGKGETHMADEVILNLPVHAIQKWTDDAALSGELAPFAGQSPQYVYVYDLQLSKKIRSDITNLLDLDDGVYLNVFSLNHRGSAPKGAQLLNFLRFLSAEEQQDDSHAERSQQLVERMLDTVYPGWKDHVVGKRIVKRAVVNGIARHVGNQFVPLESRSLKSLYFVGDSVEGRGSLGVRAYDSALNAANLIK